ncbi:hypothetical protein ABBQ38_011290 [Trebouxia sp. C0009 RCD-2024]
MASTLQPLLDSEAGDQRSSVDLLAVRVHHIVDDGPHNEPSPRNSEDMDKYHQHYSDRAPWLRAAVLGANDGLVSVASIMLGVSGGSRDKHTLILSGLSALVAGAMSMAAGEYISVASQRDTEQADVDKERRAQESGPAIRQQELEELTQIYVERGLTDRLAREVAVALTEKDAVRAHARDELGIDMDDLVSPWQAAISSLVCFGIGGGVPLLSAIFITDPKTRIIFVSLASTVALMVFGAVGAWLGGAHRLKAAFRVLLGGWIAFVLTYGVGKLFGDSAG